MLFSDRLKRELSLRECVTEKWNDELIWGLSGRPVSGLQQSCMSRVGKYPSNMHGASEKINPTMYVTELYYTKNGIPLDEDKEWEYANRLKVKKNTSNTANEFYLIPDYETVTANFDREPRIMPISVLTVVCGIRVTVFPELIRYLAVERTCRSGTRYLRSLRIF